MKKIIILLITIILLTGCTAKYNINFAEETINDTILISTDSNKVNNANQQTTKTFTQKLGEWENGHDFYQRDLYTTEKDTGYKYTYKFNYDEYDAMAQIRKCYNEFNLSFEDDIELNTSKEFLCKNYYPQINNMSINITSTYKINYSNADSISGNTHTWHITNSNYKNKPINIKIDKSQKYMTPKEEKSYLKEIIITIIFFILVIILIKRRKDIRKEN